MPQTRGTHLFQGQLLRGRIFHDLLDELNLKMCEGATGQQRQDVRTTSKALERDNDRICAAKDVETSG
jgi:hypothetical protein